MNNNKLINIIDKYGGNDDISIYTNSLLSKYKQKNDLVINKIDHLEILLTDSDSESKKDDNMLELQLGGNSKKYDLRNLANLLK
jgi:hypothetical protein